MLPAHLAVVAPAPMKGPGAHQSRVPFFRRFLVSCPDDEVGMNEPGVCSVSRFRTALHRCF